MELLIELIEALPVWLSAITVVITAANAITALTPTKIDDTVLTKTVWSINLLLKVLNVLSLNIGMNKNKDA